MVPIEGVDYSYARPDPAALYQAGKRFAVRYVTPPGPGAKGIDQAEFDQLRAAGLYVVPVWEGKAADAKRGRVQGIADAKAAQASLDRIVGLPDRAPVYFAVDWDAQPDGLPLIRAYLTGAATVLGRERVGVYGSYRVVEDAYATGAASWYWQTYAWSGGKVSAHAHLHQYRNGVTVANGTVDLVHALQPEYGVHPVPVPVPLNPVKVKPTLKTIHARGFTHADRYAFLYPTGYTGTGRGDTGTVLRLDDHTSTAKRLVPKIEGTNPLYVIRTTAKTGVILEGFTVDGGVQGHLYNGVRIENTSKPIISQVRVVRVPGDGDVPPGETFAINLWRTVDPTVRDVEVDGAHVGSSGLGYNSSTRGSTNRYTGHDLDDCKAVALWQHKGGHVFTQVQSLNNAFAFGFERCEGTYRLVDCKFRGSTRADIHLASDTGRAKIIVEDPDLGGRKLRVLLPAKEMGRPNRQTRTDLTVIVGGKPRPDLVEWVTKA